MRCDSDGLSLGSPPLVRERHAKKLSVRSSSGITPARAGKTQMLLNSAALYEDHPRSCGKDNQAYEIIHEIGGSPPLVRERRIGQPVLTSLCRITPARAGKTSSARSSRRRRRDHPRSCGKDQGGTHFRLCRPGSPPLVRERPDTFFSSVGALRITPARAGKTMANR